MNKFIKDKKKLILIISAITTILVLILVNLTSSTTSNREIEFTTRNDEITYVNINIKAILRDESKVTNNYNANLIEQNYITQAQINQYKIQLPPLEEQQAIADYLDKETSKIDLAINKLKEEISLLEESKKALISEVVTGKIDVRDN